MNALFHPPFPELLLLPSYGLEYPSGQLGSAVLALYLPNLMPGGGMGNREILSTNQNTSVLQTLL